MKRAQPWQFSCLVIAESVTSAPSVVAFGVGATSTSGRRPEPRYAPTSAREVAVSAETKQSAAMTRGSIAVLGQCLKPGTHHAIFVFCWTQRRRKSHGVCAPKTIVVRWFYKRDSCWTDSKIESVQQLSHGVCGSKTFVASTDRSQTNHSSECSWRIPDTNGWPTFSENGEGRCWAYDLGQAGDRLWWRAARQNGVFDGLWHYYYRTFKIKKSVLKSICRACQLF